MSEKQETPQELVPFSLPWQLLDNGDIVDANGVILLKVWNFYDAGHKAVRAANAHDELVAAAKAALGYLEQMYGPYDSLVRQLKLAIAKADARDESEGQG